MENVMLFVHGTWLYTSMNTLGESLGMQEYKVDYGTFPGALTEQVRERHQLDEVQLVRTKFFGSYAINYSSGDDSAVSKRMSFFNMLRNRYGYDVETFPVDFQGRPLSPRERDPEDDFSPSEKGVDIAMAASMISYASIPDLFDRALVVVGDDDFVPVFDHLQRLDKKMSLVTIRGATSPEFRDEGERGSARDYDVIWLDDIAGEIQLRGDGEDSSESPVDSPDREEGEGEQEKELMTCSSPIHRGDRTVRSRPHQTEHGVVCSDCADELESPSRPRNAFSPGTPPPGGSSGPSGPASPGTPEKQKTSQSPLTGQIKSIKEDRGFGFIAGQNGHDYFFHASDLTDINFDHLQIGEEVQFQVERQPTPDEAGKAVRVARL